MKYQELKQTSPKSVSTGLKVTIFLLIIFWLIAFGMLVRRSWQLQTKIKTDESQLIVLPNHDKPMRLEQNLFALRFYGKEASKKILEFDMDLESHYKIEQIILVANEKEMAELPEKAFGFPKSMKIIGSEDQFFNNPVILFDSKHPIKNPKKAPWILELSNPPKVRYLKWIIREHYATKNHIAAFSLDEIYVFSQGVNVALNRSVTIQNKEIPTHTQWSTIHLTDGISFLGAASRPTENAQTAKGWSTTWFKEETEVSLEFHFEKKVTIDEIRLHPYSDWWIFINRDKHFPKQMQLFYRADTGRWSPLTSNKPVPGLRYNSYARRLKEVESQQYKLVMKSNRGRYLQLSEIELLYRGKNMTSKAQIRLLNGFHPYPKDWNDSTRLYDGYNNDGEIIPLLTWLRECQKRQIIEDWLPLGKRQLQKFYIAIMAMLLFAFTLSLCIACYLYFHHKRKQKQTIQALREKISQDLHDEVGSHLAGLGLICKNLTLSESISEGDKHDLIEARGIIEDTHDAMQMIVWLLHPQRKLKEGLEHVFLDINTKILKLQKVNMNMDKALQLDKANLYMKSELIFFYREALSNIAKHSCAKEVNIEWKRFNKKIQLIIYDDGNPIPRDIEPYSLKKRADHMKGKLCFDRFKNKNQLKLEFQV